jgi:hypothetical protein
MIEATRRLRPAAGAPGVGTPLRLAPRQVPDVGQVLRLAAGDVRYRTAPLRLRVTRVRLDISDWYGGAWVWVEGHELDPADHPIAWQQALIRDAAIDRSPTGASPDASACSTAAAGTAVTS